MGFCLFAGTHLHMHHEMERTREGGQSARKDVGQQPETTIHSESTPTVGFIHEPAKNAGMVRFRWLC